MMARLARVVVPNPVHLIVVPPSEDGLRRGLSEAYRRYVRRINFREGWRGHLWQERVRNWRQYLMEPREPAEEPWWCRHERTGRPLGEPAFLDRMEWILGRIVRPAKAGRKPKPQEQ